MTRVSRWVNSHRGLFITTLIVLALVLDQALKLYIAYNYEIGECHKILPFFYLCYVENDGMAFGIEWFNKLFLTLFRIGAVGVLIYYITRLLQSAKTRLGYLIAIAMVTAGATGNIIDCLFYGKLFGYAPFFFGKVVDMLYFPLITDSAGECVFFRPVFNIADSCITVAVIVILIWYRKDLEQSLQTKPKHG